MAMPLSRDPIAGYETLMCAKMAAEVIAMRIIVRALFMALFAALLLGCAGAPRQDVAASCAAQGHAPGTEEHRFCVDAGGTPIATGPGSPLYNADESDGDL
jgi:hypothetical protein